MSKMTDPLYNVDKRREEAKDSLNRIVDKFGSGKKDYSRVSVPFGLKTVRREDCTYLLEDMLKQHGIIAELEPDEDLQMNDWEVDADDLVNKLSEKQMELIGNLLSLTYCTTELIETLHNANVRRQKEMEV